MANNIYDLRNIRVIVGSKPSIPKIKFTKEDSETCQISFELYRTSTEPLEGIDYATITLRYPSGRDATFGTSDITIVDNLVTFTLPVSALYELGTVEGELQIYGKEFKRLTVCDFKYTVLETLLETDYILDDDRYPVLTDLISIILNSALEEGNRIQNEIERQENEANRIIVFDEMYTTFDLKVKEIDAELLRLIDKVDSKLLEVDGKIVEIEENLTQLVSRIFSEIESIMAEVENRTRTMEVKVDSKITEIEDRTEILENKVDDKIIEVDGQVGIMWEDYEDLKETITDENVLAALTTRVQELEKNKSDIGHRHDELYASLSEFNEIKEQIAQNKPIVISDDCPVGTIVFRSRTGGDIPGWLWCDGSELNVDDYLELFSVIGYTYGGSGSAFNLPTLVYGDSLVTMGKEAKTGDIILSETDKQQGLIKVKRLSEDMMSVAQEVELVKGVHDTLNQSLQSSYAPLDEFNNMKDQIAQNKPIIISDDYPIGGFMWFMKNGIPDNFLVCDGKMLSKTEYPELFSVIGYHWGGSGENFKLPNMVDDALFVRSANNIHGFGLGEEDAMQNHTHILPRFSGNTDAPKYWWTQSSQQNSNSVHYDSQNADTQGVANARFSNETRPKNIALTPCIKAKQRAKDMTTIAQEWTSFKDNGGEIGGSLKIPYIVADGLSAKDGSMVRISNSTDKMILQTINSVNYFRPESSSKMVLGHEAHAFKDVWVDGMSKANNGYTKLPNGFIMQFGIHGVTNSGVSDMFIHYPISFPNRAISVTATLDNKSDNWGGRLYLSDEGFMSADKTRFRCVTFDIPTGGTNICWMAIGY